MTTFRIILLAVVGAPLLGIGLIAAKFVTRNFPFTSGIVAQAVAPDGEEVCIVQTFKDIEPYQVTLYARRPGQVWVGHYLAHQDERWRDGRLEFVNGSVQIFEHGKLRKSLALAKATAIPADPREALPAEFSPEQILSHHNSSFGR